MPLPPSSGPTRPPPPRLLAGSGDDTRDFHRMGARVRTRGADDTTFTATVPFSRPQARPQTRPLPGSTSAPAAKGLPLPLWAKRTAIGGVLLAVAMPTSVLMSRSMLVQEALAEQSSSNAAMRCTAGDARAYDDSNLLGWLFSGSYFSCGDWETRDARIQRDRDRAQANYMARERARQGY